MVRQAILSGAIKGGEQIVEAKLAQELGVGQGLVREALIELEHHGFVQRTPFTGTTVTTLALEDAQQIFEVRIELEPLAFSLAAKRARERDIAILTELVEKTKLEAKAEDLEGFFESHLEFRKKVWEISGNRYVQQALERVVIPLYALYLIRRSYNREGILQTVSECVEHEDRLLDALRGSEAESARQVARDFLIRMKEYLGTRLVPEVRGPIA
jgi:DNA-binding GntR family transcriptional regulator